MFWARNAWAVQVAIEVGGMLMGWLSARSAEFEQELERELAHFQGKSERLQAEAQELQGRLAEESSRADGLAEAVEALEGLLEEARAWRALPWWRRLFCGREA